MAYQRILATGVMLGVLAACTEEAAQNDGTTAPTEVDVVEQIAKVVDESKDSAAVDIEKLHIVEKYCIEYEHTGAMQTGTSKECLRNWGLEQARWENTTMKVAGFSQSQNQRSITKGKSIVNFDPQTLQGTKMDNPYYDAMAGAAQEKGPKEFADQMISAMGFSATDQTKEIAEENCKVYSGQMGSMCMTEDGLTLETNIAGMVKTATKVDRSSGGADADYVIPEGVTFTEVPDLGKLLQGQMPQQ